MSALNTLLDNYKVSCSLKSDSAIATSLGISRQSVFQWRNGMAWPTDDHVVTMATATGEPAERWLASINMDRASPTAKKYWMKLLQAAAAVFVVFLISRLDVQAHDAISLSLVYIMRNCGIVVILAAAACAAWKYKDNQDHAWFLE